MRMIASAAALLSGLLAAGCNGEVVGGGQRPAEVRVVSGDLQTAPVGQELPQPLVVKVVDDAGRPVRDQLVNFRVTRGGGSVFAGSAITNKDGIAQERWTLGTVADTQQVEARAVDPETGAPLVFATFRAIGTAAAAATITAVQPALTGAPGTPVADSAAALVRDPYGNPVPGVTVNWAVTSGGGSVSPASSVTSAQGIARARWTLGGSVATPQTLRASAGASMNATFTATAAVGAGATLTAVSGGGQTSQVFTPFAQPLVVEVRQNGVPVHGAQVQWTTSSGTFGDANQSTVTTATDAQGRASVSWKPGSQAGAQTATAKLLDAEVSFAGTVTAGAPSTVVPMAVPFNVAPGTTLLGRFRVTDGYGNPVAGEPITFTATYGTVTPADGTTDAGGYVDVSWSFPQNLNNQTSVAAQLRGFVARTAASGTAQTTVRPVASRIIATPEAQSVGQGATAVFTAVLEDEFGNRFSARGYQGCAVVWTAPAEVELTPIAGLQYPNVNVRSNTPGTYPVTATCGAGISDTVTLTVHPTP
ncbi:MAG TPA: Ig-like domain-containing protein [Longimicrobium sp.]|nr:Ig-like domain-containing protein [Longimicrobium sp.]